MKHLMLVTAMLLSLALPAVAGSWTASGNSGTIATFPGITANDVSIRVDGITYSSTSTSTALMGVFYSVTNTYSVTDTPPWNTLDLNYFDIDAGSVVAASLIQIDPNVNSFTTLCRATSVDRQSGNGELQLRADDGLQPIRLYGPGESIPERNELDPQGSRPAHPL